MNCNNGINNNDETNMLTVNGYVFDSESMIPIPNAKIYLLYNHDPGIMIHTTFIKIDTSYSDSTGYFAITHEYSNTNTINDFKIEISSHAGFSSCTNELTSIIGASIMACLPSAGDSSIAHFDSTLELASSSTSFDTIALPQKGFLKIRFHSDSLLTGTDSLLFNNYYFDQNKQPTTFFLGLRPGPYELQWSISRGTSGWSTYTDTVDIEAFLSITDTIHY